MNNKFLPSIIMGAVMLTIIVWFVYDNIVPQSPPSVENIMTEPTKTVQSDLYLETDPSEWVSLDETLNWNDQLLIKAENITVSRSLPADVNEMTEMFYYGFEHYQDIVDAGDDKLFLDITISATCIGLPSGSLFGVSVDNSTCTVTAGQMEITYYMQKNGQLTEHGAPAYQGRLVAVQDLANNHTDFVDYYALKIGETARFRNLHIIDKEQWDNGTVLLTPQCGRYSAEQLQWLRWQQPHMLLNKKEVVV